MTVQEERTWAIIAHLSPVVIQILSAGWASILGPLVVWAVNKDRSRVVRSASAQAFNFTIFLWLVGLASWLCIFTVVLIPLGLAGLLVAFISQFVVAIKATIDAANYRVYAYPYQIRILS